MSAVVMNGRSIFMDERDRSERRGEIIRRLAQLSPAKHALLEKRVRGEINAATENILASRIERVSRQEALPVTFRQQMLFDGLRLLPASNLGMGGIVRCYELSGAWDIGAMAEVIDELARRHEVLRTRFRETNGRLVQVIVPPAPVALPILDLQSVPEERRKAEALKTISRESSRSFNLAEEAPWRVTLVRLGEHNYLTCFAIDHFICDGWSMDLLMRDVGALYQAFITGSPSPLSELPIQFADYAHWQRRVLRGKVLDQLTSYWERKLDGIGPLPEFCLPCEAPLPRLLPDQPFTADSLNLSPALVESLYELSRQKQVTMEMLLVAGLMILLNHHTGQSDIGIRFTAAKRHRPETREVIGWFSDKLVLRAEVCAEQTYYELLLRTRDVMLEAYERQDLPYELFPGYDEKLSGGLYNPSVTLKVFTEAVPLPQKTKDNLELGPQANLDIAPIKIPDFGPPRKREPGILVSVTKLQEGLNVEIKYEHKRYGAAVIKQLLKDFRFILETAITNPNRRLSEFKM